MATYYVDGSVTSASGSGSGTIGDPWVKTDDLIQYAFVQIAAGSGAGTNGDTIIVLAGTLTNTAQLDPTVWLAGSGTLTKPMWIKAVDPTVTIDWDMGATNLMIYPYQAVYWAGFRFYNFKENGTSYPFHIYRYHAFINCIFDGYATPHYGLFSTNVSCSLINCAVINDNRYNGTSSNRGYILSISSGQLFNNYFESTSNVGNSYYSYGLGQAFAVNNIFYNESTNAAGNHVPTSGARYNCNTFYNASGSADTCIYNVNSYENAALITNNYFEGWGNAINTSTGRMCLNHVAGNKGYNNTYLLAPTLVENDTTAYDFHSDYFLNETLSESGLIDPTNKDFRPKASLIGSGSSWRNQSTPNVGLYPSENVGAIEGNIMPQRIRDLY